MKKLFLAIATIVFMTVCAFAATHNRVITQSIETGSGATATTWQCKQAFIDFNEQTLRLQFMGYVSSTAFLAGKEPIASQSISIPLASLPAVTMSDYSTPYEAAMAQAFAYLVSSTSGTAFSGGTLTDLATSDSAGN